MEYILVLDFGGSESQPIARLVRDCSVYCEIAPFDTDVTSIRRTDLKGVILAGTPIAEIDWAIAVESVRSLAGLGVPILAVGDGFESMLDELGGEVVKLAKSEPSQTEDTLLEQ
ncbi:MAG: GMP synthase (glutamine-hydrolyzing), partial [Firmicutes bacterium]|nr:GMP synthase (glutamine-hydrolyzing) [Bacillota bacterium]